MKNSYDDIRDKLGEPEWFDVHGVPRYCAFSPKQCGVYAKWAALIEIACQNCAEHFMVSVEYKLYTRDIQYPTPSETMSFHYGDPPIHGCVGDTMNCETIRIWQFWHRHSEWARLPEYEFAYDVRK